MKFTFIHTLLFYSFIVLLCLNSSAQSVQMDWTQQTISARSNQIIIDKSYNVYGVGIDYNFDSDGDIFIIKCDSSGNIIWQNDFAGLSGLNDNSFSLCLDDSANLYVAGLIDKDLSSSTGIIIKYDSAGNIKWSRTAPASEETGKVVTDGRNIFGLEYILDTIQSILRAGISKYDIAGNLLFLNTDTSNFETIGYDLAIDSSKNLYVTGLSIPPSSVQKVFLTKYDTLGNLIWKKIFNDSIYSFCDAKLLTLDDSANIYITGYTAQSGTLTGYDCILIKYDSSGLLKWFQVYTVSGGNNWESPLAIDCNGNRISITGRLELNAGPDPANLFFLSYDTDGNLLFSDTLNGPSNGAEFGNGVVIDSSGNSFVTGLVSDSNFVRQIIVMYDSLGQRSIIDNRPANSQGFKILLDNESNLYTCGSYADTNHVNFYGTIVKYFRNLNTGEQKIYSQLPEISVFPNPFINTFYIKGIDLMHMVVYMDIYDSENRKVKYTFENDGNFIKINTANILPGVYFIKIQTKNNIINKRIIKL